MAAPGSSRSWFGNVTKPPAGHGVIADVRGHYPGGQVEKFGIGFL
jgi:hypothetical protein